MTRRLDEMGLPIILGGVPQQALANFTGTAGIEEPLLAPSLLLGRLLALQHRNTLKGKLEALISGDPEATYRQALTEIGEAMADPDAVYISIDLDGKIPGEIAPLIEEARRLLKDIGFKYRRFSTFVPTPSFTDSPLFVLNRRLNTLMARPPHYIPDRDKKQSIALNRAHSHFKLLTRLQRSDPAMAAYCLAKSLLLNQDRFLEMDTELIRNALGQPREPE